MCCSNNALKLSWRKGTEPLPTSKNQSASERDDAVYLVEFEEHCVFLVLSGITIVTFKQQMTKNTPNLCGNVGKTIFL